MTDQEGITEKVSRNSSDSSDMSDSVQIFEYFKILSELYETLNILKIIEHLNGVFELTRHANIAQIIQILNNCCTFIEKFSAKNEYLALNKIILLKLLEKEFISFLKSNFNIEELLCLNLKLLKLISNHNISFKNSILSKLFDPSEEDNFYIEEKSFSWNENASEELIKICLYTLDSPRRVILQDGYPIIKLLEYLFNNDVKLFSIFITQIRKNVVMDIFNIDILESNGFSELILTLINKSNINLLSNDLLQLLCPIFQCGISHIGFKLLMKFISKTIFDNDENIHQFRLFIFKIITETMLPLLTYWNFYNYNKKDNLSIMNLEKIDYKKGFSILFIMRIYEPFHLVDLPTLTRMPVLWISSSRQPSTGILITTSKNHDLTTLCINDNKIIQSFIWNINKNLFIDTKIMINLKENLGKIDILINSTLIQLKHQYEMTNLDISSDDALSYTFGYCPISLNDNETTSQTELSKNFVGRIGSISIFNEIIEPYRFQKLEEEFIFHNFDSFMFNEKTSKNCVAIFEPDNSFNGESLSSHYCLDISPVLQTNDLKNYRKISLNYYYKHYYGNSILLTFIEKICFELKNGMEITETQNNYYLSLVEKISLTLISYIINIYSKQNVDDASILIPISKLHHLLFIYRDIPKLITINLLKVIYDSLKISNGELRVTQNEVSVLWMPFLDIFRDSDIWCYCCFDVQSVRMQLYHSIAARCVEENGTLIFDLSYVLAYLKNVHENPLKLNHFEVCTLESSIFSILSFTLTNFYDKANIYIFFKFFIENKYSNLDIQSIDIVRKLLANGRIHDNEDITLVSHYICKILQNRDNEKINIIFDFVINLSTNPHISKIMPTHTWVAFFSRICMDFTLTEEEIYNISQILFSYIVSIKKQNTDAFVYISSVFIWSFLLIQRLNMKKKAIMITRLSKIILASDFIAKQSDKLIPLMFLMQMPLWKSIPPSLFSILNKLDGMKDLSYDESEYLEYLKATDQNNENSPSYNCCGCVTIIEQVALLYLSLFKFHTNPLEFLLFPIFSLELIGHNMSILSGISVQVVILTIYLKTIYAFDQKINVKCYDDLDLSIYINVVEITVNFLLQLDPLTVSAFVDYNLEHLSDCISFLGQVIVKHLCFSRPHLKLPLMIIIKFLNFSIDRVTTFFLGLLESALDLCNPNFNHISCTLSCLYKLAKNDQLSPVCQKTALIYLKKIAEKYLRLIEEEGLGVRSSPSSYEFNDKENQLDIDNIHINCRSHLLAFDCNTWRQINVRSEEHPLSVTWLTNPTSMCHQFRSHASKYFGAFVNNLEEFTKLFYFRNKEHLSINLHSFENMVKINHATFLNNNASVSWNYKRSIIIQYLFDEDPQNYGLKKHLCIQRSKKQCVYPIYLIDSKINKSGSPLIYLKNFYRHEFLHASHMPLTISKINSSVRKAVFNDISFTCLLKILYYNIEGIVTQKYECIEFMEKVDLNSNDLRNIHNLPLSFTLKYELLKEGYLRNFESAKNGIEIYLKNKTSVYFIFNNEKDFKHFVSNFGIIDNPELIFNIYGSKLTFEHDLSITADWVTGKISHLKYMLFLNKLSGSSLNDIFQYPFFPSLIKNFLQNQPENSNYDENNLFDISMLDVCNSLKMMEPFSVLFEYLQQFHTESKIKKITILYEFFHASSLLLNSLQLPDSSMILDFIKFVKTELQSPAFTSKIPLWIDNVFGCNRKIDILPPKTPNSDSTETSEKFTSFDQNFEANLMVKYPLKLFDRSHPKQQNQTLLKYHDLIQSLMSSKNDTECQIISNSMMLSGIPESEKCIYLHAYSFSSHSSATPVYKVYALTHKNLYIFKLSLYSDTSYISSIFSYITLNKSPHLNKISSTLESKIPLLVRMNQHLINLKLRWTDISLLSVSLDGNWLVISGFSDNCVRLYYQNELRTIQKYHLDIVTCVDFCPESNILVSTCNDGTCCAWSLDFNDLRNYGNNSPIVFIISQPFVLCSHQCAIISLKANFQRKIVMTYDISHKLHISSLLSYHTIYSLDNSLHLIHGINLQCNIYSCCKGIFLIHSKFKDCSLLLKINTLGEILDKQEIADDSITHIAIVKTIIFIIFNKRKLVVCDVFEKFGNFLLSFEFESDIQRIYPSLSPNHYLCYTADNKFLFLKIAKKVEQI